ncbi:Golgin subfamily A member 5 [Cryptotermes secundus]|uniref:Golgin subfamily A member 5 n=1 Tax=Cryptotermes secundus TaxID=105785 RepID=A0A2J7QQM7_9NEOP|nr:golgin subfamily A member 5 isoform X2 [Cryptotermes secundus]PNF30873.1 Golgin subfamily A member 5 [Cryptotermes secundus]
MAWLKDLAGKAEDFLNQIDQNAAVALHKERKENTSETLLTEVTWDGQQSKEKVTSRPVRLTPPPTATTTNGNNLRSIRSSPSLVGRSPVRQPKTSSDDELIKFLNSSKQPVSSILEEQQQKSLRRLPELNGHGDAVLEERKFSPIVVEPESGQRAQQSSLPTSRRGSPRQETVEVAMTPSSTEKTPAALGNQTPVPSAADNSIEELRIENGFLKNELRSLNNEMSLLLHRSKDNNSLHQQLATLQINQKEVLQSLKEREERVAVLERELQDVRQQTVAAQDLAQGLQLENAQLLQDCTSSSGYQSQALQELQDQLAEKEQQLEAVQAAHRKELAALQERVSSLEVERAGFADQLSQSKTAARDMQQQWDRTRAELTYSRSELDQYRVRAQRILQDKERLITELRGQGSAGRSTPADDTVELELDQLRQERELLREEIAQVSARLKASRDELQETECRLESGREQAGQSLQLLQDSLQEERRKRQTAEEDCRAHAEEFRSVRDELLRQKAQLASRVRERETELTKLRSQLSQRPSSLAGDELESRLHALTQTLVVKQSSLETVTTEKNALRLQLEKIENKHRDTLALLHQMQSGLGNVNDTDDAKARVPSFLMESPFDTGVTRRVKRAYSSLDAVSIRTGVFLRRYPLARILVLCYMVLLHLWVMVVLFSYTPSGHV